LFLKLGIALFLFLGYLILQKRRLGTWPRTLGPDRLFGMAALAWFCFYCWLKLAQHFSFHSNLYDLSLYDYALFNTLRGQLLGVPFLHGSFFKEHFSPILLVILPVYALYPQTGMLLILQSLAVAGAALPLYAIARKVLTNSWLSLALVLAYLNNWYVVHGLLFDFHPEMFEPFLIFMLVWSHLNQRPWFFWLFAILALMCKEDVGLYLFFFGIFIAWKEGRSRQGAALAMVSVLWVLMALKVIAVFNHAGLMEYKFLGNWLMDSHGRATTWPAIVKGLVANREIVHVLLSVGFFPLLTVWGLLLIPMYVLNASSSNSLQAHLMLYYGAPLIPFLFLAAVFGRFKTKPAWLAAAIAIGLVAVNLHGYLPDRVTPRHAALRKIVEALPPQASVAGQDDVVPHIAKRDRISGLPCTPGDYQYVVFNTRGNRFPFSEKSYADYFKQVSDDPRYEKYAEREGLVVFKRK
jgi:uncharacterized membrane protein